MGRHQDPGFSREHGWITVGGRKFREGSEAFVRGDRAYLVPTYPQESPRQIAGPGKIAEDRFLLILLCGLVAIGIAQVIIEVV